MTTTELCACGKPADHVNADPDTDEGTWACLVPNFDPATGERLPPVGKYAPTVTPSAASGVTRADGEIDVDKLIEAIDDLHEHAWADGESGDLWAHKRADRLAAALGWTGDHGTTPDGTWLAERLHKVMSR